MCINKSDYGKGYSVRTLKSVLLLSLKVQKQYRKSVCEILNGVEGEAYGCGGLFVSCVDPAMISGIVHICWCLCSLYCQ